MAEGGGHHSGRVTWREPFRKYHVADSGLDPGGKRQRLPGYLPCVVFMEVREGPPKLPLHLGNRIP